MEHDDDCVCGGCGIPVADVPMVVALGVAGGIADRIPDVSADQLQEIAAAVEKIIAGVLDGSIDVGD